MTARRCFLPPALRRKTFSCYRIFTFNKTFQNFLAFQGEGWARVVGVVNRYSALSGVTESERRGLHGIEERNFMYVLPPA